MAADAVPITREFLAAFYEDYPLKPIAPEIGATKDQVLAAIDGIKSAVAAVDGPRGAELGEVQESLRLEIPYKLDENTFRSTEMQEWIADALEPSKLSRALGGSAEKIGPEKTRAWMDSMAKLRAGVQELFTMTITQQRAKQKKAEDLIKSYLPQDWRATLLRKKRETTEANNKAAVDALIARGGTIKEKYDLLWSHQLARRESVAQIGNASGVMKGLLKYIGGVPQVLLDFVKTINDPNGPMDEMRSRYGPTQYALNALLNAIQMLVGVTVAAADVLPCEGDGSATLMGAAALSLSATEVLKRECGEYYKFMLVLFENSPFMVTPAELAAKTGAVVMTPITISAGREEGMELEVAASGSTIVWEWTLEKKDVEFSVRHGSGKEVFPRTRFGSDEPVKGSVVVETVGTYTVTWHNNYSRLTSKKVSYSVDVLPP